LNEYTYEKIIYLKIILVDNMATWERRCHDKARELTHDLVGACLVGQLSEELFACRCRLQCQWRGCIACALCCEDSILLSI